MVKTAELVLLQKEKREESKVFGKEASAYSPKERKLSFQYEEDSIGFPKGDSIVFRKEEDFSVKGTLAEEGLSLRKKLHLLSNRSFFPFLNRSKNAGRYHCHVTGDEYSWCFHGPSPYRNLGCLLLGTGWAKEEGGGK